MAQKFDVGNYHGLITGLMIAALVCMVIAAAIVKIYWLKRVFGCSCGVCEDCYDDGHCDEHGCRVTGEEDFE